MSLALGVKDEKSEFFYLDIQGKEGYLSIFKSWEICGGRKRSKNPQLKYAGKSKTSYQGFCNDS